MRWLLIFLVLAVPVTATPFCEEAKLLPYYDAKPTFCLGQDVEGKHVFKVWLAAETEIPYVQFAAVHNDTPVYAVMDDPNPAFVLGGIRRKRDLFTVRLAKFGEAGLRATEFRMLPMFDKDSPTCPEDIGVKFFLSSLVDCKTKAPLEGNIASYLGVELHEPEDNAEINEIIEEVKTTLSSNVTEPVTQKEASLDEFIILLGGILGIICVFIIILLFYKWLKEGSKPDKALKKEEHDTEHVFEHKR